MNQGPGAYGYSPQQYGSYNYGPPQAPIGNHPQAKTAFYLGLFSLFCLGPITGIPAIYLGKKSIRESNAAPNQYLKSYSPHAAIALGCLGTFVWSAVILYRFAFESLLLSIFFFVLGSSFGVLALKPIKAPITVWVGEFILRQPAIWMIGAALVAAGIVDGALYPQQIAERDAKCLSAKNAVNVALASNNFSGARTALGVEATDCPKNNAADIAVTLASLGQREAAFIKAQADQVEAEKARALQIREKHAVDGLADLLSNVNGLIRSASSKANQGQWVDADNLCDHARSALDEDMGTTVVTNKAWIEISAKLDGLIQKIQPQLARIALQQAEKDRLLEISTERSTLDSLLSEYKDNEVRADSEYKGRWVQISGVAGNIGKDILGSIYITLGHGDEFEFPEVQCFFADKLSSEAAQISKGQRIRVRGRVSGKAMNVLVKDCEFIR